MTESEVPGGMPHQIDHRHADVTGGWLRAATFGAMDGLVSNTALIAGVAASAGAHAVVLSGVAGGEGAVAELSQEIERRLAHRCLPLIDEACPAAIGAGHIFGLLRVGPRMDMGAGGQGGLAARSAGSEGDAGKSGRGLST